MGILSQESNRLPLPLPLRVVHLDIACAMTSSSVIGPGHKEFRGQAPLQKLGFKIYQPIFSNKQADQCKL
jgi:hypothetical protein